MPGPLDGIRVVELAQWVAAPAAGAMLADWGAEVIHVEPPVRGDGFRNFLSAAGVGMSPPSDINYVWELDNRNKKSVTLDLSRPSGRGVMHRLVASADVFISNLRPYELEKFGLDYPTLEKINSRLVFASLTGYGPKGPNANSPAYDYAAFWARAGIMHMLAEPGTTPPAARPALGDHSTSLALAAAVLLGLLTRERAGIAQEVAVSLFHTGLWALGLDVQSALTTGFDFQQQPRRKKKNPLANYYQTKDQRWIMLMHLQPDPYWRRFCQAIEREDLEQDPRFDCFASRLEHNCELIEIIESEFAKRTLGAWKERLDAYGLIWAPVQSLPEVARDPQAWANEYFVRFDHPVYGKMDLLATPVKLSKTPPSIRSRAPDLGEHTEETLLALGYDRDEIAELRKQGVI